MTLYNLSFAGAGRVAGVLCREMYSKGINIRHIVSESQTSAKVLADECGASYSTSLSFNEPADIIIVAVPDHRLKDVLGSIECPENTLVAHTAGSFGLEVFPSRLKHTGVFYPLQTFAKDRKTSLNNLPFFLEASSSEKEAMLTNLAESIGGKVYVVDKEHRILLHLAAVFVCNFVNHMLTAGKEISAKGGFSFELLEPLITETVSKAMELGPDHSQTGPAVRNDKNTITKHIDLLSFSPELQNIYKDLTESIINYYKKEL
jgi:predicted short-subunit dehydrogenase-like oxidoreductase (DUF2520 family)